MDLRTILWPWHVPLQSVWHVESVCHQGFGHQLTLFSSSAFNRTHLKKSKNDEKRLLAAITVGSVTLFGKFSLWHSFESKVFPLRVACFWVLLTRCMFRFVCLWCQGMVQIYWITFGFSKRRLLFALLRNEMIKYSSWYSTASIVQCNKIRKKNRRCDEKIETWRSALQMSGDWPFWIKNWDLGCKGCVILSRACCLILRQKLQHPAQFSDVASQFRCYTILDSTSLSILKVWIQIYI